MSKPPARPDSTPKLEPTRGSATAKEAQIRKSPETTSASAPWVPIVGCIFLGLAVLFFMGLVVASMVGSRVQVDARWLVCVVLALTASIGSGFLGGSAAASGQIVGSGLSPVKFGVTGGIAVFVITLLLCHFLYSRVPPPGTPAPEITKVDLSTYGSHLNVTVYFSPVNLSPQDNNLYAEIATDKEFTHPDEELVNHCRGISPCAISFSKPHQLALWLRFVVKTPDGQVAAEGKNPISFKIPE